MPSIDPRHQQMVRSAMARRSFLRMAGIAGLGAAGAGALAACGGGSDTGASSSGSGSGGSADYGDLAIQLSWIKNIEFAGEYFADSKGYFADAGFSSVNLIAGGAAGTSAEAAVTTGKALVGLSAPTLTAPAINEGAPLKIIGATFQKNAFCIVSLATNPIPDPAAMAGKKIGVQSGGNEQIFAGLLKANGIDPSSLTIVPVQYDPTVVTTGEVDGFMAYITNEPILLKGKGFDTVEFLFADHGLPLVTETFTVAQQTIEEDRDKLKAFLKAEVLGWTDALNDPQEGARLAVEEYGKELNLNLEEQVEEINAQAALIVSADTVANGLFTMTDELVDINIESLATAGTTITAEELFDLSLLQEVYAEDPSLVTGPTLTPEAAASAAPA